ncbi:MAG: hypothetical protein RLY14_58 [Planctomycetota bacterium]
MNNFRVWIRSVFRQHRLLFVCVAILLCLGLAFLSNRFRNGISEFCWYHYVQLVGYDKAVLDIVKRRSDTADSEIAKATSRPPLEAVDQLRLLLRKHSQANPLSEDDGEWVFRIRTLRALGKYDSSLQAHALPELLYLLKHERGQTILEVRDMVLALECDALPASSDLVELIRTGDFYRVELATSVLTRLSVDCKDQFLHNEETTRAILERVRNPMITTNTPGVLLSKLSVFDGAGKICGETLEKMLEDPKTSAELKESIRALKVQIGQVD